MVTRTAATPYLTNQPVPGIFTHPEFDFHLTEWEKIRDAIGGARWVKARKERYFPRLHDERDDDYNARLLRANYFNATARTRNACAGLILRKTPQYALSGRLETLLGDINLAGGTVNDYLRLVAEDITSIGRAGTFVDWSATESRPYLAYYQAEDIIDWEEQRIDGKTVLTRVMLRERAWERGGATDAVRSHATVQIFREYVIENGVVVAKKHTSVDSAAPKIEVIDLKHRGKPLKFIPFVFHSPKGNVCAIQPPPMSDIADINLSHFRSSGDLEQGRHMCGLPTPYAFGVEGGKELYLGTQYAWTSENPEAKAGFIEFTGQGLTSLENALKEKQEQMAALGARMLEVRTADAEAFETVQLRSNAEQASLVEFSEAISATVSRCLQMLAWWDGGADATLEQFQEDTFIVLSTDFVAQKLTPEYLTALVAAWQAGAISYDTFYYNLEAGEMFPEGWTQEEEERLRSEQPPAAPPVPGTGTGGGKKPAGGKTE